MRRQVEKVLTSYISKQIYDTLVKAVDTVRGFTQSAQREPG